MFYRLEADRLRTVWCAAVRFGGDAEWDFAWQESFRPEADHMTVISSLGCSQSPEKLKKLLSRILVASDATRLRPEEVAVVLEKMADYADARSMAVKFMLTNWDTLTNQ